MGMLYFNSKGSDYMRENTLKFILIVSILCSVFAISVSYATFSALLVIDGTATVASKNWSIYFSNLDSTRIFGNAVEVVRPSFNSDSTMLNNFDVEFYAMNDAVEYEFDVVNSGSFDAIITTLDKSTPTCVGSGVNQIVDENYVCSHIDYRLSYTDGTIVDVNDTLNAGETKTVILRVSYTGNNTPTNPVDITNLNLSVIYTQN